ncbi:fibronectin type III domain-containing protein [Reinekea marina]|uniref:Fibronectin type III domain-containing protein n=1 Tax=Reinekea marina TaxID=1310421 RepID=A0ABV7WT81_9GAMM|nr:fibronectin type III domain-containing protein [Reinekea marina]MDN3648173.1 fibronectin type III domain-containing protein [Reinekea marina]
MKVSFINLFVTLLLAAALTGCDVSAFGANGGDVTLYWQAPIERANGEPMPRDEIGGYEIRYKHVKDSSYTTIVVQGNSQTQLVIPEVPYPDQYVFEVAVFDTNGIYSDFVVAK